MNVERLYTVAKEISEDFNRTGALNLLTQISKSLNNIISQQNNGTHLQQITTQLGQLKEKLATSTMNDFPPLWVQAANALGFSPFGNELYEEVNELIQKNQLTVPEAKKGIDELSNRLNARKQALDQMITSFKTLELESEDIQPGECEVGVLVPRKFVDNDLKSLSDEFKNIGEIFGVFEEIATGGRSGFKVNSISSSDFGLYIAAAAPVVLIVSQAIDKLMSAYRKYWEVKKIKEELERNQQVPDSNLKGLSEHIDSIVKNNIEELIEELIAQAHESLDQGRKNELRIELNLSLNKLANRLDRGFNIEIRINPPEIDASSENGPGDDEPGGGESADVVSLYQNIKSHSKNFSYIENDNEPIIFLTESIEEIRQSEGESTTKRAKKKTSKKN